MEETPTFSNPEDDHEEDDEDGSVKRRTLSEIFQQDKEETVKHIAQSLFGAETDKSKSKEQPEGKKGSQPDSAEPSASDLTPEEEVYVNRAIAEEHLEHPVTMGDPLPPVTDFLDKVAEGERPTDAYEATVDDNNLREVHEEQQPEPITLSAPAENIDIPRPVVQPIQEQSNPTRTSTEPARAPDNTNQTRRQERRLQAKPVVQPAQEHIMQHSEESVPAEERETAPHTKTPKSTVENTNSKESRTIEPGSVLAGELAGYIIGSRRGKNTKEKVPKKQKKIERRVSEMETDLHDQEDSLQQLSQEKRVRDRTTSPAERLQPGRKESRIGLAKPESAEHIGKVLIDNEKILEKESKPSKEKHQVKPFYPEDVKTMRREDLLRLSSRIHVGGASLKHLFENHLIGEGALRRLVEAHLKGKELTPLLRREIIDKRSDFERDPLFRDRDSRSQEISSRLLERIVEDSVKQSGNTPGELPKPSSQNSTPPKEEVSGVKQYFGVVGVIMSLVIVILIGLLIYYLLH